MMLLLLLVGALRLTQLSRTSKSNVVRERECVCVRVCECEGVLCMTLVQEASKKKTVPLFLCII